MFLPQHPGENQCRIIYMKKLMQCVAVTANKDGFAFAYPVNLGIILGDLPEQSKFGAIGRLRFDYRDGKSIPVIGFEKCGVCGRLIPTIV